MGLTVPLPVRPARLCRMGPIGHKGNWASQCFPPPSHPLNSVVFGIGSGKAQTSKEGLGADL